MKEVGLASVLLACACSPYKLAEPRVPVIAPFGAAEAAVGTICVVRPSPWSGELVLVVRDNDQLVGATRGETYFCYTAEPGEHHLVSTTGRDSDAPGTATVTVAAGHRYYAHQGFDNVWGTIIDRLSWVEEPLAREYIDGSDYRVIVSVPGTERLPGAAPMARATRSSASSAGSSGAPTGATAASATPNTY